MAEPRSREQRDGMDPITREVLRGRFDSVTEEMQVALIHASYSPIVTEGKDATSAIFDRRGRTISQPSAEPVHLGVLMDPAKMIQDESLSYASRKVVCDSAFIDEEAFRYLATQQPLQFWKHRARAIAKDLHGRMQL